MINVLRYLRDPSGQDINAQTFTGSADTLSEQFQPGGMDEVGLMVSPGNTASGTTPAFTATLQVSPNAGTTWFDCPQSRASATAAEVVVATTSVNYCEFWDLPVVETGEASKPLYRFKFTYANSNNVFTSVSCWLAMRKRNQRHP